jgi:ribosomal protein S18 acetylase RimI-like enzyme
MKKLFLTLLLASASLHAMENLSIKPFNYDTYGNSVANLFAKTFDKHLMPDELIGEPPFAECKNQRIDVLIRSNTPTEQEQGHGTPIGFLVHDLERSTYKQTFDDFIRVKSAKEYIMATPKYLNLATILYKKPLRIKHLHNIGIDPDEQGNGYGNFLMHHIEAEAIRQRCDFILITTLKQSQSFYERHGYKQTSPWEEAQMAKPLHKKAASILSAVYTIRAHSAKNEDIKF